VFRNNNLISPRIPHRLGIPLLAGRVMILASGFNDFAVTVMYRLSASLSMTTHTPSARLIPAFSKIWWRFGIALDHQVPLVHQLAIKSVIRPDEHKGNLHLLELLHNGAQPCPYPQIMKWLLTVLMLMSFTIDLHTSMTGRFKIVTSSRSATQT
jgi:hypothetical protein